MNIESRHCNDLPMTPPLNSFISQKTAWPHNITSLWSISPTDFATSSTSLCWSTTPLIWRHDETTIPHFNEDFFVLSWQCSFALCHADSWPYATNARPTTTTRSSHIQDCQPDSRDRNSRSHRLVLARCEGSSRYQHRLDRLVVIRRRRRRWRSAHGQGTTIIWPEAAYQSIAIETRKAIRQREPYSTEARRSVKSLKYNMHICIWNKIDHSENSDVFHCFCSWMGPVLVASIFFIAPDFGVVKIWWLRRYFEAFRRPVLIWFCGLMKRCGLSLKRIVIRTISHPSDG